MTFAASSEPRQRSWRRALLQVLRRYFLRTELLWVKSFRLWLLPHLIHLLVSLLLATWRVRLVGFGVLARLQREGHGVIFVGWHDKLLTCLHPLRRRGFYGFSSRSRVGDLITEVFKAFGWNLIRGSTTSGGSHALRAAIRLLREGQVICLTPDGPNGPRHECQPGAVHLASLAQSPVIAFGAASDSYKCVRTWDRHVIPLPFARVVVVVSEPLDVPQRLTQEQIEDYAQKVCDLIESAEREAERIVMVMG